MSTYYTQKQHLALVDRDDRIIGKGEKWQVHKEGILHRGYTAILMLGAKVILQHRKHPVFDDVLDLSFSSHPVYAGGVLQDDRSAILLGLEREWGIGVGDLERDPVFIKKIYYRAVDAKSGFTEHEIDYIYTVSLTRMPKAMPDFAYGQETVSLSHLEEEIGRLQTPTAPWVATFLKEKVLAPAPSNLL